MPSSAYQTAQALLALPGELVGSLLDFIRREFGLGQRLGHILVVNITAAATPQALSSNPLFVRSGFIQHIGATTANYVTITDSNNSIVGAILNPPVTSGWAGGSMPIGNVDLSQLFATTSAGTGNYLAVYYEQ